MIKGYIDKQEGEQIADDSPFQVDPAYDPSPSSDAGLV
jgi:hypothetical protein